MVWPAALESPRVTLCMTQPPSIAAHRIATAQRLSHLDLFITTASTAVRAPVLIGSASAWRLQDREFDQAHAAVVGILPFDKRCLLQPIDRDADRSRREPYFGTDRIDRQWSRAGGAAGLVLEIHRRGRSARRARPGPPRASAHPAGPDPAGRGGAGGHHDPSDDRHVGWRDGRGGAHGPCPDAPRCGRRLRPLAAGAVSRLVPPGGTPARPGPRFEALTAHHCLRALR